MFSLVKKFYDITQETLLKSNQQCDYEAVDSLEDFIPVHYHNCEKRNFTGIISRWSGKEGVINHDIYFDQSVFSNPVNSNNEKIGIKVQGTATRASDRDAWRAITVFLISQDDWDENQQNIINDDDTAKIQEIEQHLSLLNEKQNCNKKVAKNTMVDKVELINNNTAYLNSVGHFQIDDDTLCNFIVEKGELIITLCLIKKTFIISNLLLH